MIFLFYYFIIGTELGLFSNSFERTILIRFFWKTAKLLNFFDRRISFLTRIAILLTAISVCRTELYLRDILFMSHYCIEFSCMALIRDSHHYRNKAKPFRYILLEIGLVYSRPPIRDSFKSVIVHNIYYFQLKPLSYKVNGDKSWSTTIDHSPPMVLRSSFRLCLCGFSFIVSKLIKIAFLAYVSNLKSRYYRRNTCATKAFSRWKSRELLNYALCACHAPR